MALSKDEYYEEKWVGRKLLYRLHPAFDWREMPYDELCNKICDLENELKRVRAETSERKQANEILPHVSGSALLNELIPLLISYFYPTTPTSNSDEMFKKRLQIIEILNDFKAD